MVYFQPLWLEVIDFLWEGVLGTAVWGGSAESDEPPPAAAAAATAPGELEAPAATEAGGGGGGNGGLLLLRSLSQIHVTLPAPTIVLPDSLEDPRCLALRPKSFRFSTWTGGADDA